MTMPRSSQPSAPLPGEAHRPTDVPSADRRKRPGYGRFAVNEAGMREVLDSARRHFALDRVPTWLFFTAIWKTLRPLVAAGIALDDRLYPAWRAQPVRAPVFIFANARSGTTFLHRLMSYDQELFCSPRLYESAFNAVAIQRAIQGAGRLDLRVPGRPLRRVVDGINAKYFTGWDGIHKMGIDEYEEDETSFVICMNSITFNLLVPYTDEMPTLRFLDRADDAYRERFMDFYEATLKRHLYACGPEKRFLAKNVFLTPRVRTLFQRFPDARFIHLTRHPYEAVPSFLNMWFDKWATHSPDVRADGPEMRALFDLSVDYSLYALQLRADLPPENLYDMKYEDLIDHPGRAVREIYDWLGEPMSPGFRASVAEATLKQRRYSSEHEYDMEKFGIGREEIYERLRPVFEAYGYER